MDQFTLIIILIVINFMLIMKLAYHNVKIRQVLKMQTDVISKLTKNYEILMNLNYKGMLK